MRDAMLIVHFIGIAMSAGTSLGFLFLAKASKGLSPDEALKFRLNSFSLSKMGNIGLILLFISGGYLMTPYWKSLGSMPLLMIKLVLFLAIGAFIGIMSSKVKKAKKGDAETHLKSVSTLGNLAAITVLVIITLAVLSFH